MQQAEAFVMAADLVLSDETDTATTGVAAALAVLAGIAASDAACCAKLGKRTRGQDHAEAIKLVQTVVPHGVAMAKDLARLLAAKDESHYEIRLDRGEALELLAVVQATLNAIARSRDLTVGAAILAGIRAKLIDALESG